MEEIAEAFNAYQHGDKQNALKEFSQCGAVIFRIMEHIQKEIDEYADQRQSALLFEQSGTFKNEFIKLGIPAEDYDIQNNFGETDHVVDLFKHIEREYDKTRQDKTRQDKTRQYSTI